MTEANHDKATEVARDLLKFGNEPEIFLNLARAYIALRAQLAECREALKDCAESLQEWVENYYAKTKDYPSEMRRYERDIEPARRAADVLKHTQP